MSQTFDRNSERKRNSDESYVRPVSKPHWRCDSVFFAMKYLALLSCIF